MKFAVFVDYDNLLDGQKVSGILDLVTKTLLQAPIPKEGLRGTCEVRLYGGWYEGLTMTQRAQQLVVSLENEFPSILRIPASSGNNLLLSSTAELAVAMMEEPGHHLFSTFRRKGRPNNVRVRRPQEIGCSDLQCPLPLVKRLLKHGSCPISSCPSSAIGDLIYRNEQKIVDTMLTCDMIYAQNLSYDTIILVSDDDDFVPPLRTVLLRGTPVIRVHPRQNNTRSTFPSFGRQLVEIQL